MQHCVLVLSGVEGQRCSIETCLCPTKTPADNQAHFYTVHFILPTFLSTGATPIFNRFYILGSNYTDQFMSMQPRHLHAKHTDTSPRDRKHLIIIDLMGGGGGGCGKADGQDLNSKRGFNWDPNCFAWHLDHNKVMIQLQLTCSLPLSTEQNIYKSNL